MNLPGMFPYLIFSLLILLIFAMGVSLVPVRFKRSVTLSGILSAPTSLTSIGFVPEYWNPKRIVPFEIGPEDVIFSFSTGGIIWLFAIMIVSLKYDVRHNSRIVLKQYLGLLFFGTLILFLVWLTRIDIMLATIITVSVIGVWILLQRPDYIVFGITGAFIFSAFYYFVLKGLFLLFPEFPGQWTIDKLYGIQISGIPVEEIVWAFAAGAVWPLIVAYLLKVQLIKKIPLQNRLKTAEEDG
jgi:hypothetical protein